MQLYVIYDGDHPYELEHSDRDTTHRLMDIDDGVDAVFAHASTNRRYAVAMMQALPDLLDTPELFERLHIVSVDLPDNVVGFTPE